MMIKSGRKLVIVSILLMCLYSMPGYGFVPEGAEGTINGTVTDSISKEGLPFASVQLASVLDTAFVAGAMTDIEGAFRLEGIPFGEYKLLTSYMGYRQEEMPVVIGERRTKVHVSLLKISYTLSEVEVTAEKSMTEHGIEKTTINVSKDATHTGASAIDVMQSLPSVDIDMDGNIQYRGSDKVSMLINGKRSELVKSLDQIPAGQIEKIEIINNPSAKYDAEGMSGIINIVMKSGQKGKDKTRIMLYAGLPETYGGSLGYTSLHGKNSLFVNGGYNRKTRFQTKEHLRENYGDPAVPDYYQYDRQDEVLNDALINAGYNIWIDDRQQIELSLLGSKKFNTADRTIHYITQENGHTLSSSDKEIDISLDNLAFDGDLNYLHDLHKKGQSLNINAHFSLLDQLQEMDNVFYPGSPPEMKEFQNTDARQLNKEAVFSANYEHPVKDSVHLEAGYRFSYKDLLNEFTSESLDIPLGIWKDDTALDNTFHYIQHINAAFIDLKVNFRHFDLQAGLRGEMTFNEQLDERKENYLDLFPSLGISKALGDVTSVYISYNRRINRPTIKMLNPYTNEYADILNQHNGNPDLKPEYVNSVELGSRFVRGRFSGSLAVYYRNIDQAISRVKSASNDSALLVTFMNLDQAQLLGGEISFSIRAFAWWNINGNANVFYTSMHGEYGPNKIDRNHTGWTGNLSNSFKLPAGIGLQLNAYYRSPLPDVMGTYIARYYVDMAVNKKIFGDKGKLVFKISDVFNTYRYGLDLTGIDENAYAYSQRNRRKNESQYFILSFIYNIDGKEKQAKKTNYYLESFDK